MNLLYNLGIRSFATAVRLGALHSEKLDKQVRGQAETLGRIKESLRKVNSEGFDYWFHAASLGEFEQARPLIEAVRRSKPHVHILLTFFSPSGYEVRHDYDMVDCVAYLPFDLPGSVVDFLDVARPRIAIFVKYEFWGNFITELNRRGVPVYLVSAIFRPGQIFFRPWGGAFRRILESYSHIFVQDDASKQLLQKLSLDNVTVAGDTRMDRVCQIAEDAKQIPEFENWMKDCFFSLVIGSSWPPDEACYMPWLNQHPDVKAIIAPHEFDRKRLVELRGKIRGKSILLSEVENGFIPQDVQVVIVDCFGLLSRLYTYGDIALIGGGLGVGIHNINEAAVYGIPVAFGPNHKKFREAKDLLEAGAAREYDSAESLSAILDNWYTDEQSRKTAGARARAYIYNNKGATDTILNIIYSENPI